MKNKKSVLIILIAFILIIASASVLYRYFGSKQQTNNVSSSYSAENDSDSEKTKAPDFTVQNSDGSAVQLSDFFGKPIVLNFWASWCGPCKMEMPDFNAAYEKYKDEVQFIMVNLTDGSRETLSGASEFVNSSGYTFPVYYDTEQAAAATYGVTSIPATYFINSEGFIEANGKSALAMESIEKGIEMITK